MQAPVGLECRDTLCPNPGYVSTGGQYFFQFGNNRLLIDNGTNITVQYSNESLGSGFFLDCPTELVLVMTMILHNSQTIQFLFMV